MKSFIKPAYAHCDVPCGIYETDTMVYGAETCRRMAYKIAELGTLDNPEKLNTFVRCVMTKEKHAQKVKKELCILWSDYFKPEHVEKYPDLHEKLWKTAKQASTVKQTVDGTEADKLVEMVQDVARVFAETKQS